jgi:recombination DNA repair RAD52 pathway protein
MGFSANQLRALRRNVDRRNLRTRKVESGRELTYIEGWHAIAEANRIFGFDSWDRETLESRCVLAREIRGAFTAIYIARVRIAVRADGQAIIREGHGTGESQGTHPGEVHDKAIKAAETDATKRALATFGKPFGLSLYLSRRSTERKRPSLNEQPRGTQDVVLPVARLEQVSKTDTYRVRTPDSGRRRTRQQLGSDGRYYVPVRAEPSSNSFHAILAKEHAVNEHVVNESIGSANTETPPAERTTAAADRVTKNEDTVRASHAAQTALLIARPRRVRDKEHLAFVANQPCLLCGRTPSDAHHLRCAQPRAMSRKVSDEFTVPLCRTHHRQLHHAGDEAAWWNDLGVDPFPIAQDLWQQTRGRNESVVKNATSLDARMVGPESESKKAGVCSSEGSSPSSNEPANERQASAISATQKG